MTISLLVDLVVLVVLLVFLIRGIQHGFVRAFCSFLALFIALFGAIFLSKILAPPATELLAPHFTPAIVQKLETSPTPPSSQELTTQDLTDLLKGIKLPENWGQLLQQLYVDSEPQSEDNSRSPAQLVASSILQLVLSTVIFFLSFFILLFLWRLVYHSLDLVARLPVLNFCNRILGAAFGLCKALIFLLLLRWCLCDLLALLPSAAVEESYSYQVIFSFLLQFRPDRFFLF